MDRSSRPLSSGRGDANRQTVVLREFIAGPENSLVGVAVTGCLSAPRSATTQPLNLEVQTEAVTQNETSPASASTCYNPLIFYGPPGTGKTHLAHGIADEWRERRPADNVVYIAAADFARGWNDAIETRTTDGWRAGYRAADLFVLEDLGHLASRQAVQVELMRTIDALLDEQSQIVITSRLAVDEIVGLMPALASRLQAGLNVALNPPAPATRNALLRRLVEQRHTRISEPAIDALADGLAYNVPELFGALLYLEASAELERREIGLAEVERYVAARAGGHVPTLRGIAAMTARHFGLKMADLRSSSRRQAVVIARGAAMYLARQLTGKSLEQIGEYFGGRDHTTVLHGCRKTESLMKTDPLTRRAVHDLHEALAGR